MAVQDFTGKNIKDTYQRVVQTDGTNLADGTGSLLPISFDGNNVIISGSLSATEYTVTSSVTNVIFQQQSGSTIFGDSTDDTHLFTGSLSITGSATFIADYNDPVVFIDPLVNPNPAAYSTQIMGGNINIFGGGLTLTAGTIQGNIFQHYADSNTQIEFPAADEFLVKVGGVETLHILPSIISASGNITASGDISASGNIFAANLTGIINGGSF